MMMIKYSVVIPTRDRFAYLNSAIESCLVSQRDDIEVVVSINGPLTWTEILASYEPVNDPRVRYVLTGQLLSMQNNFNFGILQARGLYITTLGDDDALLPSAFNYADQFFAQHPDEPLCWFRRPYFWPDYAQQPFSNLKASTLHCWREVSIKRVQSQPVIAACCTQYIPYHSLPSIYNSFYPSSLLDKLRRAQAELEGEESPRSIFLKQTQSVDVFTAYSSLLFIDHYASISVPLSLSGISARSNGMAALQQNYGEEVKRFISELRIDELKAIQSGPFGKYEAPYIQIYNDACKAYETYTRLTSCTIPAVVAPAIARCLVDAFVAGEYISQPWQVFDVMKCALDYGHVECIPQLQQIVTWYTASYEQQLQQWWAEQRVSPPLVQKQSDNYFVLNCEGFNVHTASQAAVLYQNFLDGKIDACQP